MGIPGRMAVQPGEIALHGRRGRDDQEGGFRQAGDRQVRLDAAAGVEPLGVDQPARLDRDIVAANPVQDRFGIPPLDPELAEGGHIEQADALADRHVLVARMAEPVLAPPAVTVFRRNAFRREPVGALPARRFAETRAARLQMLVDRRTADAAGARRLAVGEMVGIEQAEGFAYPVLEIVAVFSGTAGPGGCRPPTGRTALRPPAIHCASAMPAPPDETMPMEL